VRRTVRCRGADARLARARPAARAVGDRAGDAAGRRPRDYGQAYTDFTKLSAEIGEPAIAPLQAILADRSRPEPHRILAAKGLGGIGRRATGATRAAIVASLLHQIRHNPADGWINVRAVRR